MFLTEKWKEKTAQELKFYSEPTMVSNCMRTPDGTVLTSHHRHDYVTHIDKNGKEYILDGGIDYIICSDNGDEEMLTVFDDAPHEVLRDCVAWGTYGKEGDQPLSFVCIAEMETEHLQSCVFAKGRRMKAVIKKTMKNELEYRIKTQTPA